MKNKRILKIFLFSILIVASLVTYLSYGVKEKTTTSSLNLENNKSDFTNILMEKSIMLDVKIQRRKGDYDLFNHYVSGDIDGEINDGYSLKSAFKDFIMYLEDNNSRESRGIQYYVYDKSDEKICFTNSKKNLRKAFESNDKNILKNYQWYTTIDFDENGNVSLQGSKSNDWEGSFYNTSFDQLFKNDYLDEEENDIINNITVKNPTNIKVLIAVPKKLPTNSYLEQNYTNKVSISDTLMTYVFVCIAVLVVCMLLIPVRKVIDIEPFKTVVNIKLFFMFILYSIATALWLTVMTEVLRESWSGTFAWMIREKGMAGAGVALEPLVNIFGWFVFYALIMYFIFYIKSILVFGKDFLKKHTLICSIYRSFKEEIKSLVQFDLKNQSGNIVLKIGIMSGIFIEGILLFISFFMSVTGMGVYYYSIRVYVVLTCLVSFVAVIIIMLISKKMLTQVTNDYQILLQSAHHLSQGNEIKEEMIHNISHDLKTPLTSIISYIDLLKNEDLSKEQQDEYIDILDRNTKRLKTLIEDLFEVSKVNSGNIQLNPIDLDIHALLQQVLFEYQEQFEHHHLNLKNDYENKKIICHLDSEKTYRVLENLCQNICKYALEYTRVYLQIVETNQQVIVVFKNISAHEISNSDDLTERFVQGDTSRKSEGSGLGLAICKSFVEVQGGTFEVNVDGDLFKTTIIFPKKIEND